MRLASIVLALLVSGCAARSAAGLVPSLVIRGAALDRAHHDAAVTAWRLDASLAWRLDRSSEPAVPLVALDEPKPAPGPPCREERLCAWERREVENTLSDLEVER